MVAHSVCLKLCCSSMTATVLRLAFVSYVVSRIASPEPMWLAIAELREEDAQRHCPSAIGLRAAAYRLRIATGARHHEHAGTT